MKFLVTGGAGFIGRWVVHKLLIDGHDVIALDNLSNGQMENIAEFNTSKRFRFIKGDVMDAKLIDSLFDGLIDCCLHLAAQIEVQQSLDDSSKSFENNVVGSYNVLEAAKKHRTKVLFMGTCMVYDISDTARGINELHPVKPTSPYAGSKLAAEDLALSYHHGLGLPVIIVRPFNTYGPFQKTNMEGGVVSIFIQRNLNGETLNIFGDGKQTRDLLYVEDCADFVIKAALSDKAVGNVINAGTGKDVTINELALLICNDQSRIKHVVHHHPQSEIAKLQCDYSKAKELLGWTPKTSLVEGIKKTEEWLKNRR
ncbi:NAD-dependent dehydratase [Candidatus Woesearchaeota archaeon CG08_land_8_20_14_0_20_43_7]|nr:MAG: NAD-dependent dehydratase [Candidatus Woesearchaeota archaeon CG08_land_8_20_14_0_20_43_7]